MQIFKKKHIGESVQLSSFMQFLPNPSDDPVLTLFMAQVSLSCILDNALFFLA